MALLALLAVAGVALRFAPATALERGYAATVYPQLTRLIVPVTSRSPLPVSATAALVVIPVLLGAGLMAMRSGPGRRRILLVALALPLLLLAWFQFGWGLNYGRQPLERLLGLPTAEAAGPMDTGIERLVAELAATIDAHAGAAPDVAAAITAIARAQEALAVELGAGRPRLPGRARSLPAGTLLGTGFAGVVSPFSLEAHVDGGLPAAAFTATAAHELAHLAGFAREADAELFGALAGLRAEHPFARYAVALGQWARAVRLLDSEERDAALARLPQRARDDLAAASAAGERFLLRGPARVFGRLYDRFLRSQGVTAGIEDYHRSADLLLRAFRAGWVGDERGTE